MLFRRLVSAYVFPPRRVRNCLVTLALKRELIETKFYNCVQNAADELHCSREGRRKIPFIHEAVDLIVEKSSGNLSMAEQELQKISLLLEGNKMKKSLDKKFIQKTVANVAKFNPFDLPDLIFKTQNKKGCIKLIYGLKEEGFPLTLIIWILAQACRNQN